MMRTAVKETGQRTAQYGPASKAKHIPARLGAIERMDELRGDILNVDQVRQPRMIFEVTVIEGSEEGHQRIPFREFLVQVAKTVRARLIRLLWILVVQVVCPQCSVGGFSGMLVVERAVGLDERLSARK